MGKGYKGKYPGPDKFKGDPKLIAAWKASKKKTAKADPLMEQAKKLGEGKYAPAISQIASNLRSNQTLYQNAATQRTQGLNREAGSITAAGATANKQIGELGEHAQSAYQQAMSNSQKGTQDLLDKVNANNSNMLSTFQQSMRDRGMSGYESMSPLTENMSKNNELLAAMGQFGVNRIQAAADLGRENTQRQQFMSGQMKNTDLAKARGAAQSDLSDLYNKFLEARLGYEGQKTSTILEKQDYINQTYLTLKDRAAQEKAAKAAAKGAAAAANANLAYKYEALKVNTQYKYDALSSKTAQNDIANQLRAQGLSQKDALDQAKLALARAKLNSSPGQSVDTNAIIAGLLNLGG